MPISVMRPVDIKWPITGEIFQDWGYWTPDHPHFGVDFGCPTGTAVRSATIKGEVHAVHDAPPGQWMSDFGLCVVVKVFNPDTNETWYYLYAHLSTVAVRVGQTVLPDDLIGLSGESGRTDGAHLHVQVSRTPSFTRDAGDTGDPILGIRHQPVPPPEPDLRTSLNNLNSAVITIRDDGITRDKAMNARLEGIERILIRIGEALRANP